MVGEYRFIRRDDRRAIAGVAAACASASGMPILVARILFVLSALLGFGIPLYVAFWYLTPSLRVNGEVVSAANRIWGIALLVLVPALFIIGFAALELPLFEALLLATSVGVGGIMLRRGRTFIPTYLPDFGPTELPQHRERQKVSHVVESTEDKVESIMLTTNDEEPASKLAGVCAWISGRTGLNVTFVRIAVVIATLIPPTFPLVPFLYGFAIFFVPRRDRTPAHVR